MTNAIIGIFKWINDLIASVAGGDSLLTGTMGNFNETLFGFVNGILNNVTLPVAYTILALFFVFELYKASTKVEGNSGTGITGAEMIFRIMFKLVLCKIAVDNVSTILNAIYDVSVYITTGISNQVSGDAAVGGYLNVDSLTEAVDDLGTLEAIPTMLIALIVYLVTLIAVFFSKIIIATRFIEIFVYFAIAPIPIATFPSGEMSQIGKSFLKSFAAVCIQGTLIFLVLSFYPYLFSNAILSMSGSDSVLSALFGILSYSIVLIIAILATGKWAKAICNAM